MARHQLCIIIIIINYVVSLVDTTTKQLPRPRPSIPRPRSLRPRSLRAGPRSLRPWLGPLRRPRPRPWRPKPRSLEAKSKAKDKKKMSLVWHGLQILFGCSILPKQFVQYFQLVVPTENVNNRGSGTFQPLEKIIKKDQYVRI